MQCSEKGRDHPLSGHEVKVIHFSGEISEIRYKVMQLQKEGEHQLKLSEKQKFPKLGLQKNIKSNGKKL